MKLYKYLEFRDDDMYSIRDEVDDKVRNLTSYLKDIGLNIYINQQTSHHHRPPLDYIVVGMKSSKGIEWDLIKDDVIQTFEYLSNDYELSAYIRVMSLNKHVDYTSPVKFNSKNYDDFNTLYNDDFLLSRIEISILNRK